MPKKQPDFDLNLEQVDLDPELVPFVVRSGKTTMIVHPLVRAIAYCPYFNVLYNGQFQDQKRIAAEAEAERDWPTYVFAHEHQIGSTCS